MSGYSNLAVAPMVAKVDLMIFQLSCFFVDNAKLRSGCMVDAEMHYSLTGLCDKATQKEETSL